MGKATITGGGANGKYTVTRQFDNRRIDALITKLTGRITAISGTEIPDLGTAVTTATTAMNTADAALQAAINVMNGGGKNEKQVQDLTMALVTKKLELENAQKALDMKRAELASVQTEKDNLTKSRGVADTQEIWCADFSESLAGDVGTIEPRGEGDSTPIIVPGHVSAAFDAKKHGQLVAPMSAGAPAVYHSWALLPGWQKWKPTYRIGTINRINGDLADVTLDDIRSTQQQLAINQTPTLVDVPIEYMTCNGGAFATNDRVVVAFTAQDWNQPKIIGFETNPQPCSGWFETFKGPMWTMDPSDDPSTWPAEMKDVTGPYRPVSSTLTDPVWQTVMYNITSGTRYANGYITASGHKLYANPAKIIWESGGLRMRGYDDAGNYNNGNRVTLVPGDAAHLLKTDGTPTRDAVIPAAWKRMEIEYDVVPPSVSVPGWESSWLRFFNDYVYNPSPWPRPDLEIFLVKDATSHFTIINHSVDFSVCAFDSNTLMTVDQTTSIHGFCWDVDLYYPTADPGWYPFWPLFAHDSASYVPGELAFRAFYDVQYWPKGQARSGDLVAGWSQHLVIDRDAQPYLAVNDVVQAIHIKLPIFLGFEVILKSLKFVF